MEIKRKERETGRVETVEMKRWEERNRESETSGNGNRATEEKGDKVE